MSLQPSMEQNRARGYGCLAIIVVLLLIQYPMDQIGQLVGIHRDADDTAGLLRWHLWSLAWLTVLPVSLFMVCRLFRNTNAIQNAFPGCDSVDSVLVVPVLVVSYGLIGGVWLTFIGRRGSLLSLLLSVVIAILIVAYYNKRKKEASRENADEQNSSGLSDVEQEK